MEKDDKLRNLFANYNPHLPDKADFMESLQRKMESLEWIKNRQAQERSRHRKAVFIAAIIGIVIGFAISLFVPLIANALFGLSKCLSFDTNFDIIPQKYFVGAWMIVSVGAVFTSINAYDFCSAMMLRRENH